MRVIDSDLIYRRVAIDVLKRKQDNGNGDISRFYNTIIQHDIEAIEQLPPAQPEIIHCKDCTNYDGEWCFKNRHYLEDYDYCSRAERRNDG